MTLHVNDILRVKVTSELTGATCLNVYHLVMREILDPTVVTESFFAKLFHKQIAKEFIDLAVTYATLKSTYVENLSDPGIPFGSWSEDIAGSQDGDNLATFVAFSYRQKVSNRSTRMGHKRYVGGSETFAAGNNWTSTFVTSATNAGVLLGGAQVTLHDSTLDEIPTFRYSNIILKTVHSTPPVITDWQPVTSVEFINSPTSQNTRKRL